MVTTPVSSVVNSTPLVGNVPADTGTPLTYIEAAPLHCTSTGKAMLAFQPNAKIDTIVAAGLQRFTDATITDGRKLKNELKLIRARD